MSWRLCWQINHPPGIPKDVPWTPESRRRVSLGVIGVVQSPEWVPGACGEQLSHSTHSLCRYMCKAVTSEMFGVCLHCRVFWGMKSMVIATINNLCGDFPAGFLVAVC